MPSVCASVLLICHCTCRYQRCIEAWEVACSGSVSASATDEGEVDKKEIERAEALVHLI
eukprot:COSAG02_NODE_521_length_20750_cov_10.721079_15_plen_59_part_00